MFPEEGADPDPYAHDSRPPLSISSSSAAENASHHHHHHEQQQSSINRWPPLAQYSAPDMAARAERLLLEGLPRHQYVQAATSTARVRDEAQLLLHQPGAAAGGSSPQLMLGESLLPLSMQPAEQLYNEQLLRSYNKGGQFNPLDPRMYENIHPNPELQFSTQSSNSVFSRTLESLGRAAGGGNTNEPVPGAAAAAVRYEEACTPRPRWCPTQEQIQILESLFNSGTTTPSRDMIVDIAAQLRKYGSIAEANVFYWFQNRKARAKRKLQPPPLPSHHGAAPAAASSNNEERSSSDHHTEGGSSGSSAAGTAVAGETQSKTRRVSLKPGTASSSISSTSPSLIMTELGSTASARLPCKPLLNPPLQESLLVPNRITNNPPHQDNQAAFFWPHQQLGRMEEAAGEAGTGSLHSFPGHMGSSFFRRPSPAGQHGNLQLIDPRISLSLAPPAQHHHQPPQSGRGQPAVLNYVTPSDHQILQATSKGILLIDPRDSSEENSMLDASCSSSVNPGFFSNVGNSRPLSMGGVECNQLRDQFPQSSLPLARTGDYQLATRIPVPSLPDGEDHLQLWEELDPCGNLGWGGHSQH